jgi:phenylalanyl-tRNA synthetase beta chain
VKFTLSWLKEHLDTDATLDEIVAKLTMIGLEVESVEDKAKLLAPYVIARVTEAKQHPNADRLRVCMVDTGDGKPIQVVRAAGRLHSRQEHDACGWHHPGRREPRYAGLGV